MTATAGNDKTTYLTFTLAGETFAVNVANVREVLEVSGITRVPGSPEFMRGVINLRGNVVPVVDLRLKFGLPAAPGAAGACIIVLEVAMAGEPTVVGTMADAVNEVMEIGASEVEPPPRIGTPMKTEFTSGMGRHDDRFVIILDIDRIFAAGLIPVAGEAADAAVSSGPVEAPVEVPVEAAADGRAGDGRPAGAPQQPRKARRRRA